MQITDDAMTQAKAKKVHQQLQSYQQRSQQVHDWCNSQSNAMIKSFYNTHLHRNNEITEEDNTIYPYHGRFSCNELHDPFGPSIYESRYTSIVCSDETLSGCTMINDKRKEKNLLPLDIIVAPLIMSDAGTEKLSSTQLRAKKEIANIHNE